MLVVKQTDVQLAQSWALAINLVARRIDETSPDGLASVSGYSAYKDEVIGEFPRH